ncbi:D-alanyl-D-alanine carboxypeptidase [Lentilactobacillus farraginis]|uniref:D-alanyl-D-alanine carboxypeptidase n=2 Tax=Lentilactobacillus farraginis DSM 18382 = JCM 14108 TaxID=1423743 RepID=A0A0R1VSS9_9LACO|nr:D-alanyl-D-alanine carboxypeptidase [Lentilactobacillus farraginis]KRM08798.1 hypothetical protein FD41_GL002840 [Lentilactobacillus farraginis DSM 18382 = JCM 14108]
MKKILIIILGTLSSFFILITLFTSASTSAAAVVTSTTTLTKAPYRAVSGYIYSSAALTKKIHNADHYPLTTFYATRSATITRSNGNKAVYYYIKNGNNKIRGWIWRGYLVRIINIQKQKAAINRLVSTIDSLTTANKTNITTLLKKIHKADPLTTLLKDIQSLSATITNHSDLKKIATIYRLLKTDGQTLAAIFQNGLDKLYTGVIALHNFNNHVFALARGLLALTPS